MSFEERHRDNISRLKVVLIVTCLIAIPVTFWVNHSDVGSVNKRVTKVESPCLRYGPKSPQCKAAFEAAVATITHPQACAIERKAGSLRAIRELASSLGVEFREPCAGARIAQERQRGNERDASSQLNSSGSEGGAPASSGRGGAPVPGEGADSEPQAPAKSHGPRHQPPPAPAQGGGPTQGPTSTPTAVPTQQQSEQRQGGGGTGEGEAPTTSSPGLLESVGSTVGKAGEGVGNVVSGVSCSAAELLHGSCSP